MWYSIINTISFYTAFLVQPWWLFIGLFVAGLCFVHTIDVYTRVAYPEDALRNIVAFVFFTVVSIFFWPFVAAVILKMEIDSRRKQA